MGDPGPSFAPPSGENTTLAGYRAVPAPNGPPSISTPTNASAATQPAPTPGPPAQATFAAPRRRLPALLTVVAFLVVGGVVALASLRPAPEPVAAPPAVAPVRLTAPRVTTASSVDRVPFSTPFGDGVLTVVDHTRTATRLSVTVTVTVTAGRIEVDPSDFSVLDAAGAVHELDLSTTLSGDLAPAALTAGQSITGRVQFLVPRGGVALLMTDSAQGVTAITIPA